MVSQYLYDRLAFLAREHVFRADPDGLSPSPRLQVARHRHGQRGDRNRLAVTREDHDSAGTVVREIRVGGEGRR
jgi:hypothetical protein